MCQSENVNKNRLLRTKTKQKTLNIHTLDNLQFVLVDSHWNQLLMDAYDVTGQRGMFIFVDNR